MLPRTANTASVVRTNATRLRMFARVAAFGIGIKRGSSLFDPAYRERELQALLETLNPKARALRRVLIHDHVDRDAIAEQLLHYRNGHGDDLADIIDMLTMYPVPGGGLCGCSARLMPDVLLGRVVRNLPGAIAGAALHPPVVPARAVLDL
jgi:hypothetical protein